MKCSTVALRSWTALQSPYARAALGAALIAFGAPALAGITDIVDFQGVNAWDAFKHLILPSITLATIPFAVIFRITRASVLEVLDEDFVRTAESKGLTNQVIRTRHVLRNALLPVTTTIGLQVGGLLAGAVLTERVFSFGGIGEALALSFQNRDYAVLQVLILASAMIFVLVNLIVDILYAVIDPRVRTR